MNPLKFKERYLKIEEHPDSEQPNVYVKVYFAGREFVVAECRSFEQAEAEALSYSECACAIYCSLKDEALA